MAQCLQYTHYAKNRNHTGQYVVTIMLLKFVNFNAHFRRFVFICNFINNQTIFDGLFLLLIITIQSVDLISLNNNVSLRDR